jgi:hypothetical protein
MRIYLDVETLPGLSPTARAIAAESIKPPGTLKKPETIAAWWQDEAPAAIDEAHRKQALDAAMGELCAVGFAGDDAEPVSLVRGLDEPEAVFLVRALDGIRALLDTGTIRSGTGHDWPAEPFFIAHNAPFDLGFLLRRCWVNGTRPPFKLPTPSAREGKDYGDTMSLWAGYRGTISLDRLCRALGVPSPKAEGMDGSQVFDLWQAGDHERIATYNAADVLAVRRCWQRLNWERPEWAA